MLTQRWSGVVPNPLIRWIYLTGNRVTVAVVATVMVVGGMAVLVSLDVFAVGAGSAFPAVLRSGVLSGMITLLSLVVSINQLILSRIFGTAGGLWDDLEGSLAFRETLEDIASVDASPNEPDSFIALIGETLRTRVRPLSNVGGKGSLPTRDEMETYVSEVTAYAEKLAGAAELDDSMQVLILALGTQYADHIDTTRALQQRYGSAFSAEASDSLTDVLALLKSMAVMRQFYKTLTLQQSLAQLSRDILYTGVPAILVTFFIPVVYSPSPEVPTALDPQYLPLLAVVGTGFILLPLFVLVAYILRIATITLYSVSVGTFTPPSQSLGDD